LVASRLWKLDIPILNCVLSERRLGFAEPEESQRRCSVSDITKYVETVGLVVARSLVLDVAKVNHWEIGIVWRNAIPTPEQDEG
jgi:hypothetical protein